jgi:hypothetical protein
MADQLQLRGGSTTQTAAFTGALREVTVDTDKDTLVVHDGAAAGGYPLLRQDLSNLPAGTIDNADINASAAIAGTKVSPDFGSQTVQTTGVVSHALATAAAPSLTFTGDPNTGIYSPGADQVSIATGGTQRATVDASGRLLVGKSSTSSTSTVLLQGNSTDSTAQGVLRLNRGVATPAASAGLGTFVFGDSTDADGAYITGERDGGTWSGASKPTRLVFSTAADGSASPTERMRISSAGDLMVGKTAVSYGNIGCELRAGGIIVGHTSGGPALVCNRSASDGNLVEFYQDTIIEGTISVSGTTVSYNGAHLSRWSQLPSGVERTEILRGTVLTNLGEMCEWIDAPKETILWQKGEELPEGINVGDIKEPATEGGPQDNEQLNRMKVSDVEGDKNVAGVFQAWDDDDDTYTDDFYCAMTGDFIIRIAEGVTVERGDLLMSAGDGTAKPQDDDIIRSKTIAKVTSTNVSCTYEDGSYCVPCVLMAC